MMSVAWKRYLPVHQTFPFWHRLEIGKQGILGDQFVDGIDGIVDGGVVDQIIGVHGSVVEFLHGESDALRLLRGSEMSSKM